MKISRDFEKGVFGCLICSNLYDEMINNLDKGRAVVNGIYLDFAKAFDIVLHKSLIHKVCTNFTGKHFYKVSSRYRLPFLTTYTTQFNLEFVIYISINTIEEGSILFINAEYFLPNIYMKKLPIKKFIADHFRHQANPII